MPYFNAAHALRGDRLGARRHRGVAWSALVLSAATAAATLAPNAAAQRAAPGTVTTTAAVSGVGTFNTGLDGPGSFRYAGVIASGSITKQIDAQWSVGINAGYTYENWSFDTPTAFGPEAPWGSINRPSVGFNVAYQAGPDLGFFVAPQFEWDYESGASGNRNNFGAVVGATKVFSRELVLGLGAGIFRQIDNNKVFPFLIVNWQIDDKWKLTNPFRAGPAGGAGLELVYRIDDQWEAAGGGTYRDYRFRLKDSGPNANGIGQNQGVPLFARLSRTLAPKVRLDLYAGAVVGGTLKLRDPSGNTRVAQDYGAAPFLALTVAGEF
ncbi:MAG TPA: hypothetical protein VLM36_07525 [Sphingomicrobium sp.]|nr:hypothetical protein [Sphingomicrobium sp.]